MEFDTPFWADFIGKTMIKHGIVGGTLDPIPEGSSVPSGSCSVVSIVPYRACDSEQPIIIPQTTKDQPWTIADTGKQAQLKGEDSTTGESHMIPTDLQMESDMA